MKITTTKDQGNGLLTAAGVVALSGLASRALGVFRDRLFADRFGAGDILDAYFAAYRIPDLLYNLLILGALSAAFLPVVTAYLARGERERAEAFRMANALLTITVSLLALFALVLGVLAPLLMRFLAPGFSSDLRALATTLTRIMLLQPIFLGLSSVVSGLLLAHHRFLAYAAAPVLYNAGIIVGILFLVPVIGLAGLAWGVVLGAALHVGVQLPGLSRVGFRFQPTWEWRHPGVRKISQLFVPRLIGLVAQQANLLVVTILGSGLLAGSIASYIFADNLQAFPVGVFGISLAVAAFPLLSSAAARQDASVFREVLNRSLRLVFFFTLPLSVFVLLLRAQIVRVVLGTGAFDWTDTQRTFAALGVLALSIVAQSAIPLLARAFFSLHDTRTPMFVSLAAIVTNVTAALLLARPFGVTGLAWAVTLSALLQFGLLLALLHVRLGGLQDTVLLGSLVRSGAATLVAGLVIQGPAVLFGWSADAPWVPRIAFGLKGLIASAVNMQTFAGVATQFVGSMLGGLVVFIAVALLLRSREPALVWDALRRPRRTLSATD